MYLLGLAVYRLYFSPIARFPGPKLAALSFWYEFYYDVVCGGRYWVKIIELHDRYGKFSSCFSQQREREREQLTWITSQRPHHPDQPVRAPRP